MAPPPRSYRSKLRAEGAAATRARIIRAAHDLFRRRGYEATTIQAVADEAGVAFDTVFAAVGRKPVLFREMVEAALSLSDAPRPIHQRPFMAEFEAAADARAMLRAFVSSVMQTYDQVGPLLGTLDAVAPRIPELTALKRDIARRRAAWIATFARDLDARHPLPTPTARAEALLDAMTELSVFENLVTTRGWATADVVGVLADGLLALLYPAGPSASATSPASASAEWP